MRAVLFRSWRTCRHEQDAATWQSRLRAAPGVVETASRVREAVAEDAGKPLPASLTLWTSPAAVTATPTAELDALIEAASHPSRLHDEMRATSAHWSQDDDDLFAHIQPHLTVLFDGFRQAGLSEWWHLEPEPDPEHPQQPADRAAEHGSVPERSLRGP